LWQWIDDALFYFATNGIKDVRTKEETERLREQGEEKLWEETIKPYRNYFKKRLECYKAYAAFYLWYQYRIMKNSNIESAASKTLKEIAELGIKDEIQTFPWQTIEKILYHAAAENKINVDKIRDSKVIQAQLELIRREQEAGERERKN
jgi:hypothetical protein